MDVHGMNKMKLLRELTENRIDHIHLFEALDTVIRNTKGGKVKGPSDAKSFFKANPDLTIAAAAMAVSAYNQYQKNKRDTIRLHAKDAYEKKMMTSIVDALIKEKKFRVQRVKFDGGSKTWILKRIGV